MRKKRKDTICRRLPFGSTGYAFISLNESLKFKKMNELVNRYVPIVKNGTVINYLYYPQAINVVTTLCVINGEKNIVLV
jgi:hypothetical protein